MELVSALTRASVGLLLLIITLCCTGASGESGHWETRQWCVKYVQITQRQSYTSSYGCGWWGWWRCTRTSYRVGYGQLRQEYCCKGAVERGGACMIYVIDETTTTDLMQTGTATTDDTTPDVTCGLSKFNAGPQIVGGTPARTGEFPWMASMITTGHFCGGTIINDRWILTAAHCVSNGRSFRVRVGEHDRYVKDANEVLMDVANVIYHRSYSKTTIVNDIAMVKLRQRITFNDYVTPACLPSATKQVPDNTRVTIAGWGVTAQGPKNPANGAARILQKSPMQKASLSSCRIVYGSRSVTVNSICVTDGQSDRDRSGCYGDSGGPLLLTENDVNYVIGITSFGSGNGCAVGQPVVYTNVAKYIDWIDAVMAAYP